MPRTGLSLEQKKEILLDRLTRGVKAVDIAREFNITHESLRLWIEATGLSEWYQKLREKQRFSRYPTCPKCGSPSTLNKEYLDKDLIKKQQLRCCNKSCRKYFSVSINPETDQGDRREV